MEVSGKIDKNTVCVLCSFLLSLLLIVLINTSFSEEKLPGRVAEALGSEKLMLAYYGWTVEDLSVLLQEQEIAAKLVFEPLTGFRPPMMSGRFFNIHQQGFRSSGQMEVWPPPLNEPVILFFGGSTTFGFGLPDNKSIPATVKKQLVESGCSKVHVYNFGRPAYVSSQEVALMLHLIRQNVVPTAVVFIDGMNEFGYEFEKWANDVHRVVEAESQKAGTKWYWPFPASGIKESPKIEPADPNRRIQEWAKNKEIVESVAKQFKFKALFVWQPVPVYKYDMKFHLFAEEYKALPEAEREEVEVLKQGYSLMDRRKNSLGDNFLWLADTQEPFRANIYIDRWHYNSEFSVLLARRITERLLKICKSPAQ